MSDLFLGKIRQIDAAIRDTNEHIACLEETANKHRQEVAEYQQEREKVLKAQEFCNTVLVQLNKALVMLDKLDPSQMLVFKNAVDSQFNPDTREPLTEEDIKTTDNSQTLPPLDEEDAVFTEIVPQLQFKVIREQFAQIGIDIGNCYWSTPETKCWVLNWNNIPAKLVWENRVGWDVDELAEDGGLQGNWRDFDLHKVLQGCGIDLDKLVEVCFFAGKQFKVVSWKEFKPFDDK